MSEKSMLCRSIQTAETCQGHHLNKKSMRLNMRPSCRSFATILFLWTLFGTRGDILTAKRTTSKNQCSETQKVACAPGVCRLAPRTQPEAYTCDCGETAYLDRRFSPGADPPFNISCKPLPFDPCQACHPKHTIVCKQLSDSQTVCECYGEFSQSTNCHKLKNGCEEVPLGASLSGNTACRTENGNLCLPNLGTLDYTCVCLQPYRASKGHNFPNCMGEAQSRCDDQLCVGFNPTGGRGITPRRVTVASEVIEVPEDERGVCLPKNGSCHCPPNWYNAHCTFRRGELKSGSWTPWSPCHPDCLETSGSGSFRVGFRVSQALCSTQDDWRRCQGHFKTWRRCSIEKVCTDAEEDGVRVAGRVSPEVAREAAWVLRKHTEEKENATTSENASSLHWWEKNYLLLIFISLTIFGFTISVIFMELVTAIRMPKTNLNITMASTVQI